MFGLGESGLVVVVKVSLRIKERQRKEGLRPVDFKSD